MRVVISCAFNENAIWALSRHASSHGLLTQRLVPAWDLASTAGRRVGAVLGWDAATRFAERKGAKVAASHLPEDVEISRVTELIRIAGARVRTPVTPLLGQYAWKAQFDRRVGRVLRTDGTDVVIGMPGSSLRTFARHPGPVRVFHAIDTHPRARNAALRQAYGRRAWAETYPEVLSRRIEAELELADVVLVPSEVVRTGMVEHGVDPAKIELVPYGVDLDRFRVDPGAVERSPSTRPRLICVGQISLRKGIPLLIEAVRGLDVQLSLVGQVFDRGVVRDLPGNVDLLGALSPADLARAYNRHDAMVLPTVDDACSLVVAEAAASGLRVVTTSANGAGELLPAGHVIVAPGDVVELRRVLSSLSVLDVDERRRISDEVRSLTGSRMRSWAGYAETVFASLVRRLRGSGAGPVVA
ncbi:Glycosyltransferase involved in cell wall bisynthesis [Geodermatophilus saharensis]|uniref:Glycosyltransferase involved in cell wall bisynthesis n=1 Tax=Geodermatophilus saharensis TaxID=1137994 RepID=A0A239IA23_9ACTN|nr:glycosyltransferase family 4 protein [Geodermatophilus saharensis]SNS90371.1 Glycosyltransferase involved in cell wall bisynthesis [Geodermatophilus saharensis]